MKNRIDIPALKSSVSPANFYGCELPTMPPPRHTRGWTPGGLCCFHQDEHAGNFRVHLGSGAYYCFSCGAKGKDVIDFVRQRYGLDFRAAVQRVLETAGARI